MGVVIRVVVTRIGNTADRGVSGLDERQAAGLLSAVGGNGLSLVEPGPATDPAWVGLNNAMNRAYHAWVGTQPQLILELWGGLDETDGHADGSSATALRLVEPAASPGPTPSGPPQWRARLPQAGPCRISPEELRGRGQEGA